jgi:hypothetical protein
MFGRDGDIVTPTGTGEAVGPAEGLAWKLAQRCHTPSVVRKNSCPTP